MTLQPSQVAVDPPWVVLASPGTAAAAGAQRPTRQLYLRLTAVTALVLVVVGLVAALLSFREAEREATVDATQRAVLLCRTVVEPSLEDAVLTGASRSTTRLDTAVRRFVLQDDVVRVKLWDAEGRILYSDEPRLTGSRYVLDGAEKEVLLGRAPPQARVTDLSEPENRFEAGDARLLEVYTQVRTPGGTPLLFETYYSYEGASRRVPQIWRGFALITYSSLALLLLLLLPLFWRLVLRLRRTQEEREMLLVQSAEASTAERRRIATTLHDGVVQDLAGAAFILSGATGTARRAHEPSLVANLERAAEAVRSSIGGLRALLVEIHPPSLAASGLEAVLIDLVEGPLARGVDVRLELPDVTRTRLDRAGERLVFRVAQECLRNALQHAQAQHVTVRLADLDGAVLLSVTDDGAGFAPDQMLQDRQPEQYGLRLMVDAARQAGAELRVRSAPGRGTCWELEVRAP